MRVRWSSRAQSDLRLIIRYILQDSRPAAERVFIRIHDAGEALAAFPRRGRPGPVEGTRELIVAGLPYVLIYRVAPERVVILRVLHGAQERR